jgi:hypothetical protein
MNIYLTKENEEKLRNDKLTNGLISMSGLINQLLERHFEVQDKWIGPESVNVHDLDLLPPEVAYDAPPEIKYGADIALCDHDNPLGQCEYGCK